MVSANGPSTPGLLATLALTRRKMLPSSVNRPWAESNRNKAFGAQYRSGRDSQSLILIRNQYIDCDTLAMPRKISACRADFDSILHHIDCKMVQFSSSLPFCLRFNGGLRQLRALYRRCKTRYEASGWLRVTPAGSTPARLQTISSTHVHAVVIPHLTQQAF